MRRGCNKCEITKILFEVSRVISSSFDLDEVIGLVLEESIKALDVDHAAIFLLDEPSGRLMLSRAKGFSQDQVDNIKLLGSWEVINGHIMESSGPIMVNNINRNRIFKNARLPSSDEKLPVESFLAAPLRKDNAIIGTLIVSNRKRPGYLFDKDDQMLLVTLSNHIAIAIANAKLFEELSMIQAEIAQQEKMAVIGTLSAGINHEINNPLTVIRGECEVFLEFSAKDPLEQSKAVELVNEAKGVMKKIVTQAERVSAIASRLSNFAKPAAGIIERIDIPSQIDEVLGLVGYELKFAQINVEKQFEDNLPGVMADKKQFQEVLFNLIKNAAQAINKRGTVTIAAKKSGSKVIIDIKDTGCGIPEEKAGKLFKAFFTTKEPGKGTGLGLYIVRKIVEKNGGAIYLKETRPGQGTTFGLEFNAAV